MERVPPTHKSPQGRNVSSSPAKQPVNYKHSLSLYLFIAYMILTEPNVLKCRQWTPPQPHPTVLKNFSPLELKILRGMASPALIGWQLSWWLLAWTFPHNEAPIKISKTVFPWAQYHTLHFIFKIYVLPIRARIALFGPIYIRDKQLENEARRPLSDRRWGWMPGIAHANVELYTTLAETTTTADPGSGGALLAVANRSSFPQTGGVFHVIVQDADPANPTQPKYPPTNREIMLIQAPAGAGAGNLTILTRAAENATQFPAIAHASGSYVAITQTAGGIKNMKMNATGFFNVKDAFGAKGDGATDDLAAFNAAFAGLDSPPQGGRGGIVLIPPGDYKLSAAPTLPSTIVQGAYRQFSMIGAGIDQSRITRASGFSGVLFDYSGTITAGNVVTRRARCVTQDLTFEGFNGANNGGPGTLIRCFYFSESWFQRVKFDGNAGAAIQGVEFQDCRFDNCRLDSCAGTQETIAAGTSVGQEAVRLLGRDDNATSGNFGYTTDNCNHIYFIGTIWTSGAVTNHAGWFAACINGGSSSPHRCYFVNCKNENISPAMGAQISAYKLIGGGSQCLWFYFINCDITGYVGDRVTWFSIYLSQQISFKNIVFDDASTTGVTHAPFRLDSCGSVSLDEITVYNIGAAQAGDTTAAALIHYAGSTSSIRIGKVWYGFAGRGARPVFSGAPIVYQYDYGSLSIAKSGDQLLAGIAAQSVTDLSFPIDIGETWTFRCVLFTNNTASDTGGCKVSVNAPAGATLKARVFGPTTVGTSFTSAILTALATLSSVAFGTIATFPSWIEIEGTVRNGATAGTVQIQAAEGTATDDITIQANSELMALQA